MGIVLFYTHFSGVKFHVYASKFQRTDDDMSVIVFRVTLLASLRRSLQRIRLVSLQTSKV